VVTMPDHAVMHVHGLPVIGYISVYVYSLSAYLMLLTFFVGLHISTPTVIGVLPCSLLYVFVHHALPLYVFL
jgi:hypothetical protein